MKSSEHKAFFTVITSFLIFAMLGIGIAGYYCKKKSEFHVHKISVTEFDDDDSSPDPLPPNERLEDLCEVYLTLPLSIPGKEICDIFVKKEYSIKRLPDCTCEVFTPPPKQTA